VKFHKGFFSMLPHGREYTELEAAFSVQIDSDNENRVTIAGYADLWKWSRGRVARFLGKLGVTIKYDNPTEKLRNQRGHINGHKTDISTQKNGHKTDISADTTIKKEIKNKENTYSPDFERAWKNHPRKDGSKFKSHKKWLTLKKQNSFPDIETILRSQDQQKESRTWRDGYAPHFLTWLNGRMWEAEPYDSAKGSKNYDPDIA